MSVKLFFKSVLFACILFSVTFFYFAQLYSERFWCFLTRQSYTTDMGHQLCTRWGRSFFALVPGWRSSIQGIENLRTSKLPFVIVANHESAADILALYLLEAPFRWLSKNTVFKLPMMGTAMKLAGYVSIERGSKKSHAAALEESANWIQKKGVPMLFFPEGTRSTSGSPKEFKSGAFRLAMECNVGVLPITLHGAGTLLKKRSLAPNRACIQIHIAPLLFAQSEETPEQFAKRVELQIKSTHADLLKEALGAGYESAANDLQETFT